MTIKIKAWCKNPNDIQLQTLFVERLGRHTNRPFEVDFRFCDEKTIVQAQGRRIGPATLSKWSWILRGVEREIAEKQGAAVDPGTID